MRLLQNGIHPLLYWHVKFQTADEPRNDIEFSWKMGSNDSGDASRLGFESSQAQSFVETGENKDAGRLPQGLRFRNGAEKIHRGGDAKRFRLLPQGSETRPIPNELQPGGGNLLAKSGEDAKEKRMVLFGNQTPYVYQVETGIGRLAG